MTARPGRARELSDDELAAVARWVAVRTLEIRRGLRPAACLSPIVTDQALACISPPRVPARTGPVTLDDVGGLALSRVTASCARAVACVREVGDRWAALLIEFRRAPGGRWVVADLTLLARIPSTTKVLQSSSPRTEPRRITS